MIRLSIISSRVRLIVGVLICLITSVDGVSQTPYTGYFIAPNTIGGQTDDYLNIKPRSGVGETNSWNVYHKDNSPLLSVYFGKATPYIHIGQSKVTNLYVNGQVGIGTTTPTEMLDVRGSIVIKAENSAFGIDDALNARLGFVKKSGYSPVIASSNGNPIIFSQSNQPNITTNISTATFTDRMIIAGNGNVGIGTSTPRGKFDVDGAGDVYLSDDLQAGTSQSIFIPGQVFLSPYNGGNVSYFQAKRLDNSGTTSFRFRTFNNGTMTETLHMEGNGNVGIGTITPEARLHVSSGNAIMDNNVIVKGVLAIGTTITSYTNNYSLAVNGKIGAKDIQIESKSWPDYVFASNYKLPSLSEVEQYILKNKHLQDMPSAEEVSKNGYSVSEVETAMLKKIEELTLYIIELQKQVDSLNAKLEKR